MLTGDNARTATHLAASAGISEVHAELRPEDKAGLVERLAAPAGGRRRRRRVAMVGDGINAIMRSPEKAVLLITHYQRLLDYVTPAKVHILAGGRIVTTGGPELAQKLEVEGYEAVAA